MFRQMIAACVGAVLASSAYAETNVQFALDWRFEGPSAPYFVAIDKGYFADVGLEVEIQAGQGSLDAIPKVATGAFPFGFADMNSVIKFLDQNPDAPVQAVMMVYDKPAFSVVGRKSLGVSGVEDLKNITLGAPPPDSAWAHFPAFAKVNGIDMTTIDIEPVGFPTREPMLAAGEVDAVTGFSFTALGLIRLGIPEEDVSIILMADHGLELYGNAIIVNTDYAADNPEIVRGFVSAVAAGWKQAIADPADAIVSLRARNPAVDDAFEQRRLQMSIDDYVLSDYTLANGMGGIDTARFERALEQLAETYEFENEPQVDAYFSDAYLPEGRFQVK